MQVLTFLAGKLEKPCPVTKNKITNGQNNE